MLPCLCDYDGVFFVFVVVVVSFFLVFFVDLFVNLFVYFCISFAYIFHIKKKGLNECAHFKTLFLRTGIRVRAEIFVGI